MGAATRARASYQAKSWVTDIQSHDGVLVVSRSLHGQVVFKAVTLCWQGEKGHVCRLIMAAQVRASHDIGHGSVLFWAPPWNTPTFRIGKDKKDLSRVFIMTAQVRASRDIGHLACSATLGRPEQPDLTYDSLAVPVISQGPPPSIQLLTPLQ